MSVSIVGTPTWGFYDTSLSVTIPTPSGVTAGDVLFCVIRGQNEGAIYESPGWTSINHPASPPSGARTINILYMAVQAPQEVASSYTFSRSSSGGRILGTMFRTTGTDGLEPVRAVSNWGSHNILHGITAPAFNTLAEPGDRTLFVIGAEFTGSTLSTPAGSSGYALISNNETPEGLGNSRTALAVYSSPSTVDDFIPEAEFTWVNNPAVTGGLRIILQTADDIIRTPSNWTAWSEVTTGDGNLPTYGEITIQGTPVVITSGGNSVTIPMPSDVESGETLLAIIRSQATDGTNHFSASDWTLVPNVGSPSSGARTMSVLYQYVENSALLPTNATFTKSGNGRIVAVLLRLRGAHPANPITEVSNYSTHGVEGLDCPTFPYSNEKGSLLFSLVGSEWTAERAPYTPTPTTGDTHVVTGIWSESSGISNTALSIFQKIANSPPEPARTFLFTTGNPTVMGGFSFIVRSDDPEPVAPPVTGLAATIVTSDGLKAAQMEVFNGSELRPVVESQILRPGFETVAQMLATPGFTWGHRGNSILHAEMSLHAYTQTVAYGHGVLELSMGRTSDDVWVGTHDNDLNRVTGLTGLPAIRQMTWAQVQALTNISGTEGKPQPFMRWEELRDAYGDSHLLVLDPKNYSWGPHFEPFLEICEELGPERVIVKSYATGTDVADEARVMGYETWGHNFEGFITNPELSTLLDKFTTLGIDYNAPQSDWNILLATGKPVIGHIAPTQAAYDTSMSKGSIGVQCSGTHVITPISAPRQ